VVAPAIFLVIFNLMLWCYWSQLEIAIAIIDCAADFFNGTKRIILVSVFYFLLTFCFFLFTIASAFYIYSMSEFIFDPSMEFGGHFLG
jgi:hypothetical protein